MLSLACAAYSSCPAVKNGFKFLHSCKSAPPLRMMQIGAFTLSNAVIKGKFKCDGSEEIDL